MTKIVVFSDSHFRKTLRVGDDSIDWLKYQLNCLDQVFGYCIEKDVDHIVFNGDLFEVKSVVDVVLFNKVWEKFYDFKLKDRLIFNTGNHDIATVSGESILKPFGSLITVVEYGTSYSFKVEEQWTIRIVPFGSFSKEHSIKPTEHGILILHEEIEGLTLGCTNYKLKNVIPLNMLKGWDIVVDGHIHKPQRVENVYVVGSMLQQDFGEAGEDKYFLVLDINKNGCVVDPIPIKGPRFYKLKGLDDPRFTCIDDALPNEFFRIDVSPEEASHPVFNKPNVYFNVVETERRKTRVEDENISDEELVELYVKEVKEEKDEYEKLIEIGKKIIRDWRVDHAKE